MQDTNESSLRLYLRLAVKLMLCVAVCGVLWILIQATGERSTVGKESAAVTFDVTDMKPGDVQTVNWANRPLLIVYRTPEWKSALETQANNRLKDPLSSKSVQPAEAVNVHRSVNPDWFVALGLGTGMGCPLRFIAPSAERYQGEPWPGGFADTCDSTRYDLAGRVFRQQSAQKNIVVPDWQFVDGKIIVSE